MNKLLFVLVIVLCFLTSCSANGTVDVINQTDEIATVAGVTDPAPVYPHSTRSFDFDNTPGISASVSGITKTIPFPAGYETITLP